jgi:hypothetical protein
MKWILLLPLAAVSAGAQTAPLTLVRSLPEAGSQTYVKPYSLSIGMSQKFEHKIVGPTITKSPYEFDDAVSVGVNYRTPQDRIKLGFSYSHTIQNGTNTVSAEIRYNVLQWGKRAVNRGHSLAP